MAYIPPNPEEIAKKAVESIFPSNIDECTAFYPPSVNAKQYLFNGQLIDWEGPTQPVESCICLHDSETKKSTRVLLADIHRIDGPTALMLLEAAYAAYDVGRGRWPTCSVAERIQSTERFIIEMAKQRETIVRLLMWEIGKTRDEAENEFDRTLDYCKDTVVAVRDRNNQDSRFTTAQGHVAKIRRSPIGVVLSMGPFNYPLNETFTTLIPAIIMGNTCVVKLPRHGALSLVPLLPAFATCFPPGVVNVFNGKGMETASPILESGKLSSLAFIGSSAAANTLRKQHPKPNRLRCSLGLDAKNAAIVLADADFDVTLKEVLSGTLSFSGQRCTAVKIVFVHESIAESFVSRFSTMVDSLSVGLPWNKPKICPLPEYNKVQSLLKYVDDAVSKGARVANRNGGLHNETLFFPAVVYPVTSGMRLWTEEQFGPVVPIASFSDIADVINYLVDSNFGQQASIFGTDPATLGPLFDVLVNQVCRVNLNGACKRGPDVFPFTARKDSAEGTLDIESALRAFSIRTMVACPLTEQNRSILSDVTANRSSQFLNNDVIF